MDLESTNRRIAMLRDFPPAEVVDAAASDDGQASALARFAQYTYGEILAAALILRKPPAGGWPRELEYVLRELIAVSRPAIKRCRNAVAANPDGAKILAMVDRQMAELYGGEDEMRKLEEIPPGA